MTAQPNFQSNTHDSAPAIRQRKRTVAPAAQQTSPRDDLNQRLTFEYLPIDSVKAYKRALRKHSDQHIAACMGSTRAFG